MKVFLSWSNDHSKDVAIEVKSWLKKVIQALEPFMSDKDIELGTVWNDEIKQKLQESKLGLVFVTSENINSSWLNYEVGALSSAIEKTKVIPILIGIKSVGTSPLSQFQSAAGFSRENMWKIIESINKSLDERKLDQETLKNSFDAFWLPFEDRISEINLKYSKSNQEVKQKRNSDELMAELIERSDFTIRSVNELKDMLYEIGVKAQRTGERTRLNHKVIDDLKNVSNALETYRIFVSKGIIDLEYIQNQSGMSLEDIIMITSSISKYLEKYSNDYSEYDLRKINRFKK